MFILVYELVEVQSTFFPLRAGKVLFQNFKWQEGDSGPLTGGSEVFSEVRRNNCRLKIKHDKSELIAEGVAEAGSGERRVIRANSISEAAPVLFQ